MQRDIPSGTRRPADDILDYGMLLGLLVTSVAAAIVLKLPLSNQVLAPIIIIVGIVQTFVVIPHAIAYWLSVDVDDLVDPIPIQ